MVDGKVDGQILFGARSETPKFHLVPGVKNGKMYLVPNDSYDKFYLAVKGLISVLDLVLDWSFKTFGQISKFGKMA